MGGGGEGGGDVHRNFVANHYLEMKKVNPKLPILIRESKNATPRVVARFGTQ